MRTVGIILKEERIKKGITLAEVALATKIRPGFLSMIEENQFGKIAEATVVKGLIKNYAEYLKISPEDILAIFRRDFLEDKKGQIVIRGSYEPLNKVKIAWTPRLTGIIGLGVLICIFCFYFLFQALSYLGAPSLSIDSPLDGITITDPSVEVKGKTNIDNVVYINGEIITVMTSGVFKQTILLEDGDNLIKIEAISRRGRKTTKEISVKYKQET